MYHYTSSNLLNSNDPVKIALIGAGGTGSQFLTGLGQINHAILELGHVTGLHVTVFDADTVSESNIGRQLFSPVDVGENKARILVERINRFYGTCWKSYPVFFNENISDRFDIVISCVDTVASRRSIQKYLENNDGHWNPIYWLDMGNTNATGQVILSATNTKQPEGGCASLPDIFSFFPDLEDHEDQDAPSCSMREALQKQDLFINRNISGFGLDILWRLFRYGKIEHHGCFVDLENYTTRPLRVINSYISFYKEAENEGSAN